MIAIAQASLREKNEKRIEGMQTLDNWDYTFSLSLRVCVCVWILGDIVDVGESKMES